MTFLRKIGLSFRYGSGYFVVAGLVSLCAFVILSEGIFICKILKILSIPIILYLFRKFDRSSAIYFWLNLGISSVEYYVIPIVIEYVFFRLLIYIAPPLFTLLHLN